jgi:nitroreductase
LPDGLIYTVYHVRGTFSRADTKDLHTFQKTLAIFAKICYDERKTEVLMKNDILLSLQERRSVRAYLPKQITDEQLDAILCAGTYAPTGMNRQSPIIVVVQDEKTRETLRRMNAAIMGRPDSDPFYGAPIILIVLADRSIRTCVEDGALVMGNLMNAAHAVGVDSCWIHRAREEFESEEGRALLRAWGIEGDYIGIGHCILGYRSGDYPEARPRKENYVYRV